MALVKVLIPIGIWKDLLSTSNPLLHLSTAAVVHRVPYYSYQQRPQDTYLFRPMHLICPLHYPAAVFGVIVSVHAASACVQITRLHIFFVVLSLSVQLQCPSYGDYGMYLYPCYLCASYLLPSRGLRRPRVVHAASKFVGSLQPHILSHLNVSPNSNAQFIADSGLIHDPLL